MLGAKVQLKLDTPADAAELTSLRALLSDRNTPTRDVNGFRKLLLLTTQPGARTCTHARAQLHAALAVRGIPRLLSALLHLLSRLHAASMQCLN